MLPTHLQVDDTLLFGLTTRQLDRLAIGASVAYEVHAGHQCQPLLGFLDGSRLSDELEERADGFKHQLLAVPLAMAAALHHRTQAAERS
jgi:hypothetical protein